VDAGLVFGRAIRYSGFSGGVFMIANLWKVTLFFLNACGKTWEDVLQVQATGSGKAYPLKEIEAVMKNTLFDQDSPGDEVAADLLLVGDHWAARWASGWVWMYVPKLVDEVQTDCPQILSIRDERDEEGCRRSVTYCKSVEEMNAPKE
jgi:hypothetical protein